MNWLRSIAREVLGLFVDDGSFAIAILVWLAITVIALPPRYEGHWSGVVLFLGLAVVLVENTLRAARRK